MVDAVRDGTTNGAVSAVGSPCRSRSRRPRLAGVPVPAAPSTVDHLVPLRPRACRRAGGTGAGHRSGAPTRAAACRSSRATAPSRSTQGSNTLRTVAGLDTGIDLDRLVLSSDAERAGHHGRRRSGAPLDESGAQVRIADSSPDSYDLDVRTDGKPFWLVLGESHSDGWEAKAAGGSLGTPQLVNGFANGWLVRPTGAGTMAISLHFDAPALRLDRHRPVGRGGARVHRPRRRDHPAPAGSGPGRRRTGARVPRSTTSACSPSTARARRARDRHCGRAPALVSRWWIGLVVGRGDPRRTALRGRSDPPHRRARRSPRAGQALRHASSSAGSRSACSAPTWSRRGYERGRAAHPVVAGELLVDRVGERHDLAEQCAPHTISAVRSTSCAMFSDVLRVLADREQAVVRHEHRGAVADPLRHLVARGRRSRWSGSSATGTSPPTYTTNSSITAGIGWRVSANIVQYLAWQCMIALMSGSACSAREVQRLLGRRAARRLRPRCRRGRTRRGRRASSCGSRATTA